MHRAQKISVCISNPHVKPVIDMGTRRRMTSHSRLKHQGTQVPSPRASVQSTCCLAQPPGHHRLSPNPSLCGEAPHVYAQQRPHSWQNSTRRLPLLLLVAGSTVLESVPSGCQTTAPRGPMQLHVPGTAPAKLQGCEHVPIPSLTLPHLPSLHPAWHPERHECVLIRQYRNSRWQNHDLEPK